MLAVGTLGSRRSLDPARLNGVWGKLSDRLSLVELSAYSCCSLKKEVPVSDSQSLKRQGNSLDEGVRRGNPLCCDHFATTAGNA